MKKYIILLFILSVFASCEEFENSAEPSKITYLPIIDVEGESSIELECDATSYVDPGASASEQGTEIELNTTVTGTYFGGESVDGPDVYLISYSAFNRDDIPAAEFRTVTWPECNGDLITSIAGMYSSSIVRTITGGGPAGSYTDLAPIIIKDLGNNVYQLSDALGGWYDLGRQFGYTGAAPGMTITANNILTNDFTFGEPVIDQTFGEVVTITDFDVNAATKTITFTADWSAGYTFDVTLTQISQ